MQGKTGTFLEKICRCIDVFLIVLLKFSVRIDKK